MSEWLNVITTLYRKGCQLCPRKCGADRIHGQTGFCGMTDELMAARAALHYWEEPCISGTEGSGAVFFSGCTLRCVFCQNAEIAAGHAGKMLSVDRLADIFLELQEKKANNLNLVTATHFLPFILPALEKAMGLKFRWSITQAVMKRLKSLKCWMELLISGFQTINTGHLNCPQNIQERKITRKKQPQHWNR